jgi:5'-3' exonuclease
MSEPCPRLFLVDGSSYIFRAFFAIPPLTNASGMPTNAILGFTNMILKLLKQYRPEFVLVALDTGKKTFRNEIFAAYKGHRPEPPADLVPQFPYFRKILEALSVAVIEMPGYEADDIIATLCRNLGRADCEIIVVSGDKDLMQLVTNGIKLLDSAKDRWIGVPEVKEKFGVSPEQVIEVMGLMGDSVDNIPDVKGIGAKTAIGLIQQFHSLENLFARLDELDNCILRGAARIRNILQAAKEKAFLSRQLATVRADVPIEVGLQDLRARKPDMEKIRTLFTQLGFFNLIKLLDWDQVFSCSEKKLMTSIEV